jgi:arylsulfatase A-like enzyme
MLSVGVILEMDDVAGRLLKTLDYLHLTGNTLIIFTSDNGPVLDDGYADGAVEQDHGHKPAGPLRGGKYSLLEGGTRIPFIVSWPEVVQPGVSGALVSQVGLLASFADLTGQKLPASDAVDSHDLPAALLGRTTVGASICVEQDNAGAMALIDGFWKYIPPHKGRALLKAVNIETGFSSHPQLYDLREDIAEKHNVAGKHPDIIKQMEAKLQRIREKGVRNE